jgi:tRNA(fMet)-specific endonuclease VapC
MENKIICIDTSVLIDYFRKKKKENSFFFELTKKYSLFAVSVITECEVYSGSNLEQDIFWNDFFKTLNVLPFTSEVNKLTFNILRQIKRKGLNIDIPDLFIGSTALYNKMKLATLNKKHFENIVNLQLIAP